MMAASTSASPTLRPLSMLVIKKAGSNNIKGRLNATDIDDRSGKEGVLVAIMTHDELVILGRLAGAVLIGAKVGFERTFHGRPAGFRTHALVCLASALLMCVTVYQMHWMTEVPIDTIRADPTRMAQGIMTGIGFLGAGVIFKEGLTDNRCFNLDNSRNRHPRGHRFLVPR